VTGPLFLTGGGGFIGRRVAARLAVAAAPDVRLLTRDSQRFRWPEARPAGWRVVDGDLATIGPWTEALRGADTVVHLAALTGKATREQHFRVNRDATRRLVAAAEAAGVRRFLFVSSIAAGFGDRSHYHYANAKAEGEALVAASGLETINVRPTMVFGPGSPVLENLRRLATLPVPVTFGPDHPVQPVHVDDLAELLVALLDRSGWDNRTIEVGGPEVTSMDGLTDLLRAAQGLARRRRLRVPIEPLRTLFAAAEPFALGLLPFAAGQLTSFANPTVAAALPPDLALPAPARGLGAMLGS
jgi:NADH dehydrogenase